MLRRSRTQLVLSVALGALAVFAVASGSAATTSKPYTASFAPIPPSTVGSGSSATITLTLTNLASPQQLGSADVTAAALGASSFTITGASPSGYLDPTQTFPGSLLKLRNLNIQPGGQVTISINVTTPCVGGDYSWGIRAKQSNDFSGTPGNDFTFRAQGSNLVTKLTGSCRLEWVNQPASANPNAVITGTPYSPGASAVAVKAVDGSGATLTSLNSGTVTLTPTAGTSSGGFTGTQATFASGVATFGSLKSSATGYGFKLRADSAGFTSSPDSGPFDIFLGTLCTTSGCQTPSITPDAGNENDATFGQAQTSSSNFVFLGIGTLDGTTCTVPNFRSVQGSSGAPIIITEQRTSLSGELYVTYGMKKSLIEKRYGNTSGEQFIPICAGSKRITLNPSSGKTEAVSCNAPYPLEGGGSISQAGTGWTGKALNSQGKFSGQVAQAACDTSSGYFVGILGSFQDYTNSNKSLRIDPSTNPTVVGWSSDNTYRYFTTRFPASSGAGAFANVPWDGWKFG